MPITPHPITVTVYDTDNSTLKAKAMVYVRNVTKRSTSSEAITNANGVALIDLANLPLANGQTVQYSVGDIILIISYNGQTQSAARYVVAGASKSQTLYLNPGEHIPGEPMVSFHSIILGNTSSTVYYAKVYAIAYGRQLIHMECPANDTRSAYLGKLNCAGGYVIERENQELIVSII